VRPPSLVLIVLVGDPWAVPVGTSFLPQKVWPTLLAGVRLGQIPPAPRAMATDRPAPGSDLGQSRTSPRGLGNLMRTGGVGQACGVSVVTGCLRARLVAAISCG